jgi:hypothetical protein
MITLRKNILGPLTMSLIIVLAASTTIFTLQVEDASRANNKTADQGPQWDFYYPNNENTPNTTVLFIVQNPTNNMFSAKFDWQIYDSYGVIGEANGTFTVENISNTQIFLVPVTWHISQQQVSKLMFSFAIALCDFKAIVQNPNPTSLEESLLSLLPQ